MSNFQLFSFCPIIFTVTNGNRRPITFPIEIFIQTQFEFVKFSFPSESSYEDYKGPHQHTRPKLN